MKIDKKFQIWGIDDERKRRVIFPSRVVFTNGNVIGSKYLTDYKPVQVALYNYHDQCILDNRGTDTHASVLVDFGREIHGSLNISVWKTNLPTSDYIVRLGESVSEAITPVGQKGSTNDHATRAFVASSSSWSSNETPESGFRFAYIELLSPNAILEIRSITATFIFRDIEYRGSFDCSDPLITKCYDTAAYTVHLNMQRYLWDGIKRDRLVWAGDMNTELATILAVFGENEVVPKSLDFVRDLTPTSDSMNGLSSYNLWWLLCHYEWYLGTGNIEYLTEQKDYLMEMLPRYINYVDQNGSEILPNGRFFDWPTENDPDSKHRGLQGLLRIALMRGGDIMKTLGESEISANCYINADKMLNHKPSKGNNKQASAILALSGISNAEDEFINIISKDGAAGLSTFLGYYTLTSVAKAGKYNEALDLIREYWGKMLELGATTFWEDFNIDWAKNASPITEVVPEGKSDIHGDFGAFCYTGLRHSLCHGWASGPAPYLAANVLGITPVEPGCRTVRFSPHLSGLDWARGVYPTPYGDIEVEVSKSGASCKAPKGINIIE